MAATDHLRLRVSVPEAGQQVYVIVSQDASICDVVCEVASVASTSAESLKVFTADGVMCPLHYRASLLLTEDQHIVASHQHPKNVGTVSNVHPYAGGMTPMASDVHQQSPAPGYQGMMQPMAPAFAAPPHHAFVLPSGAVFAAGNPVGAAGNALNYPMLTPPAQPYAAAQVMTHCLPTPLGVRTAASADAPVSSSTTPVRFASPERCVHAVSTAAAGGSGATRRRSESVPQKRKKRQRASPDGGSSSGGDQHSADPITDHRAKKTYSRSGDTHDSPPSPVPLNLPPLKAVGGGKPASSSATAANRRATSSSESSQTESSSDESDSDRSVQLQRSTRPAPKAAKVTAARPSAQAKATVASKATPAKAKSAAQAKTSTAPLSRPASKSAAMAADSSSSYSDSSSDISSDEAPPQKPKALPKKPVQSAAKKQAPPPKAPAASAPPATAPAGNVTNAAAKVSAAVSNDASDSGSSSYETDSGMETDEVPVAQPARATAAVSGRARAKTSSAVGTVTKTPSATSVVDSDNSVVPESACECTPETPALPNIPKGSKATSNAAARASPPLLGSPKIVVDGTGDTSESSEIESSSDESIVRSTPPLASRTASAPSLAKKTSAASAAVPPSGTVPSSEPVATSKSTANDVADSDETAWSSEDDSAVVDSEPDSDRTPPIEPSGKVKKRPSAKSNLASTSVGKAVPQTPKKGAAKPATVQTPKNEATKTPAAKIQTPAASASKASKKAPPASASKVSKKAAATKASPKKTPAKAKQSTSAAAAAAKGSAKKPAAASKKLASETNNGIESPPAADASTTTTLSSTSSADKKTTDISPAQTHFSSAALTRRVRKRRRSMSKSTGVLTEKTLNSLSASSDVELTPVEKGLLTRGARALGDVMKNDNLWDGKVESK